MLQNKLFDIVDTTLRDGEQTAGVVFRDDEKIDMVKRMDKVGIRWLEVGIPAMGQDEQFLMKKLLRLDINAKLIAWNRANINDINKSLECGFQYIHISVPISDINLKYKLNKDREWVMKELINIMEYLQKFNVDIFIGAEDASRAGVNFFLEIAEVSAKYGARRIRFADTVGCLNPFTTKDVFEYATKRCALPIEFHAHNDFGMATANSLAAFLSGVDYISATITGIGERAGNACLEEVNAGLLHLYNFDLAYNISQLKKLTSCVEKASGRPLYEYKPIIGKMA